MTMSNPKNERLDLDEFRVEARRLAELPASERMEELDVHRRIADDAKRSKPIRDHARWVADTLEKLIERFLKNLQRKQ
jgi:hypothetical protein